MVWGPDCLLQSKADRDVFNTGTILVWKRNALGEISRFGHVTETGRDETEGDKNR